MDISTASGALTISLLRLLHIVAGLVWVGSALMLSYYIEPTARASAANGDSFLRALYSKTSLPRLIPLSASVTTVAGLLLYGLLSYHEAMSSAMGLILTVGSLFRAARLWSWLFHCLASKRALRPVGWREWGGRWGAGAVGSEDAPQWASQPVAGASLVDSHGGRSLRGSGLWLGSPIEHDRMRRVY